LTGTPTIGSPPIYTCPSLGDKKPLTIFSRVVLPHPEGPRKLKNSPDSMVRRVGSMAVKSPKRMTIRSSVTLPSIDALLVDYCRYPRPPKGRLHERTGRGLTDRFVGLPAGANQAER